MPESNSLHRTVGMAKNLALLAIALAAGLWAIDAACFYLFVREPPKHDPGLYAEDSVRGYRLAAGHTGRFHSRGGHSADVFINRFGFRD